MTINKISLSLLGFLLLGYAFLSKGFAYVGYTPVFIGEITLLLVLAGTILAAPNLSFIRSPISWLLLLFISWQVLVLLMLGSRSTIMEQLRDSAIWYYAIFAFLVAALLLHTRSIGRTLEWYGRWLPWFVVWTPIGYLIYVKFAEAYFPVFPGTRVQILFLKPGDMGVHLAGAAAFLALGLHHYYPKRNLATIAYKELFWWIAAVAGIIAVGSRNRGGLLSVVAALAVVTALRPNNRLRNLVLPVLIVFAALVVLDVEIPVGGGRYISAEQMTANVESIFVGTKNPTLENTADWRIMWWEMILSDTVLGDRFWFGRGYGPNLADLSGFDDATGNRSPHNGHLTIMARSGVPGIILWFSLIITVYFRLFKNYLFLQKNNEVIYSNVNIWVMAYFTAFIINASFDVFLEGPQGGIWFWSVIGFAIALTYSLDVRVNAWKAQRAGRPELA